MATEDDSRPWESLEQIVDGGDPGHLEMFIDALPPGEVARAISRIDSDHQNTLLTMLGPQRAAELLQECPEPEALELLEHLPAEQAAAIVGLMPSDERADLLAGLPPEHAEAILREMGPEAAAAARSLASYPKDEAGGLMVTEYLAYPEAIGAGQVVDDMRSNAQKYRDYDVQYVYCLSPFGELVGVLRLRDLLLAPSDKPVCDFMIRKPLSVDIHASLDELADHFGQRGYLGVPVVDAGGKLVGVVKRSDVEQALSERAQSVFLKSMGIVGGDELRTMPLRSRVTRRLSWLTANIVLNIAAAAVVAIYQDTLEQVIALAVFLPIISDMSGNAGIQAIAVSLREMTLGLLKPSEFAWVFFKEFTVGVINGAVLGVLVTVGALLWKGNLWLGLVVGVALALNTVLAAVVGGVLPLVFRRLKLDPALSSGPVLTTVTDMCGFFFVLSFASAVLPKLTTQS